MPDTMFDPVPLEFVKRGDDIVINVRQAGVERLVHMNSRTMPTTLKIQAMQMSNMLPKKPPLVLRMIASTITGSCKCTMITARMMRLTIASRLDYTISKNFTLIVLSIVYMIQVRMIARQFHVLT